MLRFLGNKKKKKADGKTVTGKFLGVNETMSASWDSRLCRRRLSLGFFLPGRDRGSEPFSLPFGPYLACHRPVAGRLSPTAVDIGKAAAARHL